MNRFFSRLDEGFHLNKAFRLAASSLGESFHLAKGFRSAASSFIHTILSFFQILLGGRVLLFLVGAGFFALTACAGGGGGGSSGGSSDDGSPASFEVNLTIAPYEDGVVISNQTAFGSEFADFVSVKVTATSHNGTVIERNFDRNTNITELVDGSYNFAGLDDQSNWTFEVIGTLSNGEERELEIIFTWEENEEDLGEGGLGIRPGANHDGDGRPDILDPDDDNDLVVDGLDGCAMGETGWTSGPSTDHDGDGCRDAHSEDPNDDNDGFDDENDACPRGEIGWPRSSSTDSDDDGCHDADEDPDDDNNGLIEIATAEELDAVRYALDSGGRRLSDGGKLDEHGCGPPPNGICSGYELIANISLAPYADADGGKGWQPLGHDVNDRARLCQGDGFSGVFEGNGWTITNLSINRPDQGCIGFFGQVAEDSEIRNLTIHADRVIGLYNVGALVGAGEENGALAARIISSSVVVNEVRGSSSVGGLVGWGEDALVRSSSVVANVVSGDNDVSGLVGSGRNVVIYYSSVVAAKVEATRGNLGGLIGAGEECEITFSSVVVANLNGTRYVGGLVGDAGDCLIRSSSVVADEVDGRDDVGGLIGGGLGSEIYSSSVVTGEMRGTGNNVGGLAGSFDSGKVAYSYVVSGSNTSMLVEQINIGSAHILGSVGVASYWDNDTSGINSGAIGEAKTSNNLTSPTDYTGVYEKWDNTTIIFAGGAIRQERDIPFAVWCDEDGDESIEAEEQTDDNRIWDFGTSSDYPAIRCTPIDPVEWRSWWSLEGTPAKPQLNRARLDALVPSLNE